MNSVGELAYERERDLLLTRIRILCKHSTDRVERFRDLSLGVGFYQSS